MQQAFRHFWTKNPALLLGLYLLLATAFALFPHPAFIVPCTLLIAISSHRLKCIVLACCCFFLVKWRHPVQPHVEGKGIAHFSIAALKIESSPFNRSFAYTGTLKEFSSDTGEVIHNLPCKIYHASKEERMQADCDYLIEGNLKEGKFKADKYAPWEKIPDTHSLAEWRFQTKESFRKYLKRHLANSKAASFLCTLTTGDMDERSLSYEFGKLGLQHLLAISGFHFGLLAIFLNFIMRPLLPRKISAILQLFLLSAYFFFIGNSPSVQRAWIALSVLLTGRLFDLRGSALNTLGCALIAELLIDPTCLTQIAFQLSFSATFALLLLFEPFNYCLKSLFPERPVSHFPSMTGLEKHAYLLSAAIRKSLALNLAIHFFTLPILLFLFSRFPYLSLVYNLFFPFWVGISLLLLLVSLPFPFLHGLNNFYTSFLLEVTAHPPPLLNHYLYAPSFSFTFLILLICISFVAGLLLHFFVEKKKLA